MEDEFLIAKAHEEILGDADHAVVGIAASLEEALALAEARRPDLVLMDFRIASARDSIEAAIEMRRSLGIPSLFTSANNDPDNVARAEAAEPAGWVPKPYSPELLTDAVAAALGGSGAAAAGG